jgi:hypothetical protein
VPFTACPLTLMGFDDPQHRDRWVLIINRWVLILNRWFMMIHRTEIGRFFYGLQHEHIAICHEDWTWSDIPLAVTSGGIKLVGVDDRIHLFSRPYVKHSTPAYKRTLTAIYNPDNLSSINSLPSKFKMVGY